MKRILLRCLPLAVLLGFSLPFAGCKSDDSDVAERPWNAPKSWETGLPSSMTEGR